MNTHTPPGKQTIRPLHASVASPFAPAMRLAKWYVCLFLHGCGHLLSDTHQFCKHTSKIRVSDSDRLLKIDVKDVFLSGDHGDIMRVICRSELGPLEGRQQLFNLIEFLLCNQFVASESSLGGSHTFHKVLTGTGMGRIHSGDLTDMVFYLLAEADFALRADIQAKYSVRSFVRYTDDIFVVIGGTRQNRKDFVTELRARSKFFRLEVESMSTSSTTMLDTEVYKGPRWEATSILDIRPYQTPTSIRLPLLSCSAHPPSIHKHWPISRFEHFARVSSSPGEALVSQKALVSLVAEHEIAHPALPDLILRSRHAVTKPRVPRMPSLCSWLVLPYNPAWLNVKKVVRETHDEWKYYDALYEGNRDLAALAPRVSWKLGSPHLINLLARCGG